MPKEVSLTVWEATQAAFMMQHCKDMPCMGMGYGAHDGHVLNISNLIAKLEKFVKESENGR